jgi:hypothetical protein
MAELSHEKRASSGQVEGPKCKRTSPVKDREAWYMERFRCAGLARDYGEVGLLPKTEDSWSRVMVNTAEVREASMSWSLNR